MSEEITEKAFRSASDQVDEAHHQAVKEVRAKVEKAKSGALSKVKS